MFSVRGHLPVLLCLAHALIIFYFSFEAKFFSAHDTLALILSVLYLVLSGDVSDWSRSKSVG